MPFESVDITLKESIKFLIRTNLFAKVAQESESFFIGALV